MKRLIITIMAVLMVLTLFAGVALTAPLPPTADVHVSAAVAQAVWLNLDKANVALEVDPSGDTAPTSDSESLLASVRSNWNWVLTVSDLDLIGTDPSGNTAELEDSYLSINSLNAGGGNLASGGKTNLTAVPVTYTLDVDYGATPANYSGWQTYTLTFN